MPDLAGVTKRTSSDDVLRHIIRDIVDRSKLVRAKKYRQLQSNLKDSEAKIAQAFSAVTARSEQAGHPSNNSSDILHPKYPITDSLATVVVKAVVQDPELGFVVSRELSREEVEDLINVWKCAAIDAIVGRSASIEFLELTFNLWRR